MELDKILVYDYHNYFSRLLKYKFKKDFDFKVFKSFDRIKNFDEIKNDYSIIVFVIYSETDLFDFVRIYGRGFHILVAIHNKEILKKMKKVSDIFLLDISSTQNEMLEGITNFFSMHSKTYIT
ncbi:hypothetical protein [Flavobacterium collinsii]|uniref:Response regulatory domain-containing protein n=1 Tax=Flavobacterium collinsii TaxID=1114861 RepID=A0ABN7ENQ7_9FLAO|nr:hypothetical protein [Flavobacterium collinsii]GIQ61030.1 hypothetical protein Flavo103_41660 [Flavobacterium collinsii]CAA9200437.1 hypothetical protein FLACOL7796_03248 [Flavobacterium collinsii]